MGFLSWIKGKKASTDIDSPYGDVYPVEDKWTVEVIDGGGRQWRVDAFGSTEEEAVSDALDVIIRGGGTPEFEVVNSWIRG